jgi:hypothetical protein
MTKTCIKCGFKGPEEKFKKNSNRCEKCKKEYNKQWRLDNPDYSKQWKLDHPGYNCRNYRQWRLDNPEYTRRRNEQWRLDNPEYCYRMNQQWYLDHPGYQINKQRLLRRFKKLASIMNRLIDLGAFR